MMISRFIRGVGRNRIIFLEFKKVYPDAQVLMMERNYRSSKEIVEMASKFIKRNQEALSERHAYRKRVESSRFILNSLITRNDSLNM